MTMESVALATPGDAALCNALEPPTRGVDVGGGVHVVIPADWQARIAAGQQVPGCTYAALDAAGALLVDDLVQTQLATPAVVNALTAPQQAQAAALNAKLATAIAIDSAQVAQTQQEVIP